MNMTEKPEFCKCSAVEIGGRNFEPLQDQLVSPQEASLTTSSLQHLGTQPGQSHYIRPSPVYIHLLVVMGPEISLPINQSHSENIFSAQPFSR